MTAHGSDASQGSHSLESVIAYVLPAVAAHLLGFPFPVQLFAGVVGVVAFTGGKELPQMYDKGFEGIKGDAIDVAVHLGTILPCAGIHYLVS